MLAAGVAYDFLPEVETLRVSLSIPAEDTSQVCLRLDLFPHSHLWPALVLPPRLRLALTLDSVSWASFGCVFHWLHLLQMVAFCEYYFCPKQKALRISISISPPQKLDALTPQMQSLSTDQDAKKSRSQALRGMWKTAFKMAKAKSRESEGGEGGEDGGRGSGGGDGGGGGGGGGEVSGEGGSGVRGGTPSRDSATPEPEEKKGPKLYLITQKLLKKRASKIEEGAKEEDEVDPVYALLQSASETRDKAKTKRSGEDGSFDESEDGSLSGRRSAESEETGEASRDSLGVTPGATPQHPQGDAGGTTPAIADSSASSLALPATQLLSPHQILQQQQQRLPDPAQPQRPPRNRRGSPRGSSPTPPGTSVPIPILPPAPSPEDEAAAAAAEEEIILGATPRPGLAPEPSTALDDDSPSSSPEKKHKSFGFGFFGGKKKKSSASDLAEALEAESKSSLAEAEAPVEVPVDEDPLFKLLNEGAAKRNRDRNLNRQKTLSGDFDSIAP